MVSIACLFTLIVDSIKVDGLRAIDLFGNFGFPETLSVWDSLWNIKTLVANLFLIFSGWPYFSMLGINNPTWYCCVLIQCYIVFFIFMKNFFKAKKLRPYLFILIAIFSCLLYEHGFIQNSTFRGLSSFFIGCYLSEIYKHAAIKRNIILIFLLFLASMCLILYQQKITYFLIMFATLILMAAQINCPEWFHELAQISFEVFIWHAPLMYAEKMILRCFSLPEPSRNFLSMIIFTCFVWLWGFIMYRFLEKNSQYSKST